MTATFQEQLTEAIDRTIDVQNELANLSVELQPSPEREKLTRAAHLVHDALKICKEVEKGKSICD